MQLNTKIEYVIRALVYLAENADNKPVNIRAICQNQNLPVKYMEQLFSKLKRKKIVTGIKGSMGGYLLNYAPEDISLKDIMSALEDDNFNLNCKDDKEQREFCNGHPCFFYSNWLTIKDELDHYFGRIPLSRFMDNN